WRRVPQSSMLRMALWLATEIERQEFGHYLIHASAVVRGERAIMFSGAMEAGKTTAAVEMCRRHGFSLFSNDQTIVALHDERPYLVRGDPSLNFRLKSLLRYSTDLARHVFGSPSPDSPQWNVKRRLEPEQIGLTSTRQPAPITEFVFIKLDDTVASLSLR